MREDKATSRNGAGWLDIAPVLGWEKGECAGVSGIINGLGNLGRTAEEDGERKGLLLLLVCTGFRLPSLSRPHTHSAPWHKAVSQTKPPKPFCLTLTTGTPSSPLALMTGPWSSLGRRLRPPPPLPKMEFMSMEGRWNCREG